jgi:hypothetical protein
MTAVEPSAVQRAGSSGLAEGQKVFYEVQVVRKRRKQAAKSMRLTSANGVAVRSLHFPPEVSQQRVEKVAGMVVLCIAVRDLTDVWIHYAANGFGAEQLSSVRPLLQQSIGYIVRRSEHPQKGMFGLGLVVVMSLRRIESE